MRLVFSISFRSDLLLRLRPHLELISGLDGGLLPHLRLQEGQLGFLHAIVRRVLKLRCSVLLQCGLYSERLNALDEVGATAVLVDDESGY